LLRQASTALARASHFRGAPDWHGIRITGDRDVARWLRSDASTRARVRRRVDDDWRLWFLYKRPSES